MTEKIEALLTKHYALHEELSGLNPFRESDMDLKPELERELLGVGAELADAVAELVDRDRRYA